MTEGAGPMIIFDTFLCRTDNIGLLVRDEASDVTIAFDAPDAGAVEARLAERGWRLTHILVTHRHEDHVAGIGALTARGGVRVVAPKLAQAAVPGADAFVGEGDRVEAGQLSFDVWDTPGHCADHISYVCRDSAAGPFAVAGDTLFTLGCGRVLEGPPEALWRSLERFLALPDETRVWCGHEYTLSNLAFARSVDAANPALAARGGEIEAARAEGRLTVPTTMGAEKATNPFLRASDPTLAGAVGLPGASAEAVFVELRARKNRF